MDEERFESAARALILNIMLNTYAIERVAFGYEKPGDKAPVDKYLEDLHLDINDGLHKRSDVPGVFIDEQECISTEHTLDDYIHELFVYKMEDVFGSAPKDARAERRGDEIPLLPRFREYVIGLEPLFKEIIQTEIQYDFFDLICPNADLLVSEHKQITDFITAILVKPLKASGRIDRYVSGLQNTPPYVERLISKNKGHYFLTTADVESLDYKLAVLNAILFMNRENNRVLELKIQAWEKTHL